MPAAQSSLRCCPESSTEGCACFSWQHLGWTSIAFQVSAESFVCICLQHLGWQKDREYLRLDGKTVAGKRQALVDSFQDPDSPVQVWGSIAVCVCRKGSVQSPGVPRM